MRITNIRLRELEGTLTYPDPFMEERLRWPIDIYPRFKVKGGGKSSMVGFATPLGDNHYKITSCFVQIDTDEGVSGLAGPIQGRAPAFYIDTQLRPLLMGKDPIATELLWDWMYRAAIHGRKGDNMLAISYVDIALWDIKGKWLGQPVYRLLGGPVQEKIPAYASALGYSIEPERAKKQTLEFKKQGYTAMKWFPREGPTDGSEGERKNVALVRALREAAGPDMKIMLDAWCSWDIPYTLRMAELLKEHNIYWFEEMLLPDLIDSHVRLRALCPVKIAGAEHEYTRWGAKLLMDKGALDIYQIDPLWAGGISEAIKICALASAYDVPVIFHGSSPQVNAQVSFTQNVVVTPMMEYLVLFNEMAQFFFKNPMKPVDGYIYPPETPGIGIELDESKIESEREISWR